MTDSDMTAWQRRVGVAEKAVAGSLDALETLREEARLLADDPHLLRTPAAAKDMSYFLALLRELGPVAGREYDLAVDAVRIWVENVSVPLEDRCAVYSRIGTVLSESGNGMEAFKALRAALNAAVEPSEEAYVLARLGELELRYHQRSHARVHAEQAVQRVPQGDESATWLDVRMRSAYTLLRIEYRSSLVRELVDVCGRQIDRWGNDHPRALEALTIMAVAQRADASERGDLAAAERFTDVLAVTAQRSASLLGARHPQARAARQALQAAHRVTQEAQVRHDERARATSRPHQTAVGSPTGPGDEGRATETPRSSVSTVVGGDSAGAADLRGMVTRARLVLWDFDGPICRLFVGHAEDLVVDRLSDWLEAQGTSRRLGHEVGEARDPYALLRAVVNSWPTGDLVAELEERLTQEELRAVPSAWPTPFADPLIRTWSAIGARQAIVTNLSPRVARTYLEARGLTTCFAPHVYGRTQDLNLLKPHPHAVNRALNATGTAPSSALMIGDDTMDHKAARQAGIPFLGYARNDLKAKQLRDAGAELIVDSLEQVLYILRTPAG
ncbi:HAD hydrolase-like protein [Streptomyces sp. NPDC051896]|uniref:HAD hydrolase-like protein n=1 Tax=Streptomyces sp. NPDC051896 TaxID=3155416 RepID=UPI00344388A9